MSDEFKSLVTSDESRTTAVEVKRHPPSLALLRGNPPSRKAMAGTGRQAPTFAQGCGGQAGTEATGILLLTFSPIYLLASLPDAFIRLIQI